MYSEERQHVIRQELKNNSKVQVTNLAKKFKVSEVTVRRDLAEMEDAGLLKRTFGGAVSNDLVTKAQPYSVKKVQHLNEKRVIAECASKFVSDGMTLFLDAGTTTKAMVPFLLEKKELTIVTVDLQIALELLKSESNDVYIIGGKLSSKSKSVNSVDTVLKINDLHFDSAFIGCDAFDLQTFETDSETKAQIKRIAIQSSAVNIIVTDGSKLNKHSFSNFSTIADIDHVVTDWSVAGFLATVSESTRKKVILGGS